ncbi:FecCD family ABC transporter permease [Microbacterium marinilacus]|uniref:Iron-enterobactin ABC transporter permease n=1 Tax=Microbacterium marinilacus TaxID=415209 RepID=A0ABP7BF73_9MICO|nr:iron chelate uptake ABC transporter family permease subunit [Microbacterium marinilacus]
MSRPLVVRAGGFSVRTTARMLVVCAILAVCCVGLAAWAITLGSFDVTIGDVLAVAAGTAEGPVTKVVSEWRAPRVLGALLFGAALGVAGGVFQAITRNPLGSPDVIGFTTGSYTGVVAVLTLGMTGYAERAGGALVGGILAAVVISALSYRGGLQGLRLVIVGIAVGAFLGALNTWFTVKADIDLAMRAAVWGAGTLSLVDATALGAAAIALAGVAVFLPAAQRRLRRLELGDDTAAMLGIPVERTKVMLIALAVAAIAAVTAAAGPIAFVALAAPQIGRRLTGHGASTDLMGSALVGALLLLLSDIAAQHAIPGTALPTGAVTVCVGGLYLLILLVRESRRFARGEGR